MDSGLEILRKKISWLIFKISRMNYGFRIQNFDMALRHLSEILMDLDEFFTNLEENRSFFEACGYIPESANIIETLNQIFTAQGQEDYVLVGDLFELSVLPFLKEVQNLLVFQAMSEVEAGSKLTYDKSNVYDCINGLVCDEKNKQELLKKTEKLDDINIPGYKVEFTSCGEMTLAVSARGRERYMHSNGEVRAEARLLANSWYKEGKEKYLVYGLGFGYHIEELATFADIASIEVYESDPNIILLASAYGNVFRLLKLNNIKIIYDPDFSKLTSRLKNIGEDEEFVLHYPSLLNIHDDKIRESFEEYFVQYSSIKNQLPLLRGNFKSNIKHYDNSAEVLTDNFKNRDVFIVAAGPSLDKNFHLLKNRGTDSIVIATGTVFRKLLSEGINPDYVIVSDGNERVYAQISGLEHLDIPMLFLSTAYKGFAQNYKGKKYLLLQEAFELAEEYAAQKGYKLFETGGSVSTTALDVAIKLGAKRIIFLGLDLAYTDNYVHASNTSRRDLTDSIDLREVKDINGKLVRTSKSLLIYRKWIENHIKKYSNIQILNATEGGIPIAGMKNIRLSDIIN